jgi:hypothetical protein
MSEFVNPLDDVNFTSGGGLWDGKSITVLQSGTDVDLLAYKDGSPVIDSRTGEQSKRNVWKIVGQAEDEDRERQETYSLGSLVPTPDGEGFVKGDGTLGKLHSNSEAGKLAAAIKASGYDVNKLYDAKTGKTLLSKLVGATFTFKAEPKLDKDGNIKKNKKGYTENRFFPVAFVGQKDGVGAGGNGAVKVDADLLAFATKTVTTILNENGGTLSRAGLTKEISTMLKGDPRNVAVISLVIKDEFYEDSPIKREGTQLSLG